MRPPTETQVHVLGRLVRGDVLVGSPYHYGAHFLVDILVKPSVHPNAVRALERRRYIKRDPNPNPREYYRVSWLITNLGRAAWHQYRDLPALLTHQQAQVLRRLSAGDDLQTGKYRPSGYFRTGGYVGVAAPTMQRLILYGFIGPAGQQGNEWGYEWCITDAGRKVLEEYDATNQSSG